MTAYWFETLKLDRVGTIVKNEPILTVRTLGTKCIISQATSVHHSLLVESLHRYSAASIDSGVWITWCNRHCPGQHKWKVKENDVRERVTTGCSNFAAWNESVAVQSWVPSNLFCIGHQTYSDTLQCMLTVSLYDRYNSCTFMQVHYLQHKVGRH